jgi:hemerythrin superfamily protein
MEPPMKDIEAIREDLCADEQGIFAALVEDHRLVESLFAELAKVGDDSERAGELCRALELQLMVHANVEDRVVYMWLEQNDDLTDLIDHARDEHAMVESILRELEELEAGGEEFMERVEELHRAVMSHVQEEETEVLPKAAAMLAPEASRKLAEEYEAEKLRERDTLLETEPALGAVIDDQHAPH